MKVAVRGWSRSPSCIVKRMDESPIVISVVCSGPIENGALALGFWQNSASRAHPPEVETCARSRLMVAKKEGKREHGWPSCGPVGIPG
jgi:hypothetical protein